MAYTQSNIANTGVVQTAGGRFKMRALAARVSSWLVVIVVLFLLVEFPRGVLVDGGQATSPIHTFKWRQFIDNIHQQLHAWLTGSAGQSVESSTPLRDVLHNVLPSLELLLISFAVVLVMGTAKGLYDGVHTAVRSPGTVLSNGVQWTLEAVPDFTWVMALIALSFWLDQRGRNIHVFFAGSTNFWTGTLVPALILSLLPVMYVARAVRLAVESQFEQQYLTTASAKGIPQGRVVVRHLLPNCYGTIAASLIPVIGMLLSALVVVEFLFARRGIVNGLFQSMGNSGALPVYSPVSTVPSNNPLVMYYNFDPVLCLYYLLVCVLMFALLWLIGRGILRILGFHGQTNPFSARLRNARTASTGPWALTVGAFMLMVLLAAGLFANKLPIPKATAKDLLHFGKSITQVSTPPFPPSPSHWLGTDVEGHDLLSLALHGTLTTFGEVGAAAFLVVAVAALLAFSSSVLELQGLRWIIHMWSTLFTLIPGVIGVLLLINIPQLYWAGVHVLPDHWTWGPIHVWIYFALLCLVECGRVASNLQFHLDAEFHKEYMEAAWVSGNSRIGAFFIHVLRTMLGIAVETLVAEFVRVLVLIAVLGYLQVAIRANWWLSEPPWPAGWHFNQSASDWGALIAANSNYFRAYPWVLFAPILFITWTVIALNLTLTGIQKWLNSEPTRRSASYPLAFRIVSIWIKPEINSSLHLQETNL
ncbi:ABC transporter permease subunit [Alicyclobacillus sp. ALC3]|uniref:ABC transporter permease subunit n=1 Tax=Alicyclobacillus sp. ALC3 TaxID=2796143 RepID=UPI002378D084|nr:ABC transporter permease subunit [Alicyclobacillus sp. ALC3]WDL98336.1 ABC transporter permease subunit [Alicyclobacillus sp. ALC3]